jgi:predicted nucleic acid-binding Zn ribbon protein
MSPKEMAAASRCSPTCTPCLDRANRRARRARIVGFLLIAVALTAIAASLPVEGLPGVGLAVVGIALLWTGWHLVVHRGRKVSAR